MIKLPRLIGVCGTAGSGKDVAANFLTTRYGYTKYALSSPIKFAISQLFGLSDDVWNCDAKDEPLDKLGGKAPRDLAQTLGTEWGRNLVDPDVWIRFAAQELSDLNLGHETFVATSDHITPHPGFVISDIRFGNEARWINENGGVVIRIDRPAYLNTRAINNVEHISEDGVPEAYIDAVIDNDCDIIEFLQRFAAKCESLATNTEGLDTEWYA